MDPKEQVKQLEVALIDKEAQIRNLTERVSELGSFRQEALNTRGIAAEQEAKIRELETSLGRTQRELAEMKAAAASDGLKKDASEAKLAAALKVAEGIKALL